MSNSIVFAGDLPSSTIAARLRRGDLVRLATGVYTTDVDRAPHHVVADNWVAIVSTLMPDTVITDRSAPAGGPVDGYLWLSRPGRAREIHLPGLTVVARPGKGALAGDLPLNDRLHVASRARGVIDNARGSRSRRQDRPRRTLTPDELGSWIDRLAVEGADRLTQLRRDTEDLHEPLGSNRSQRALVARLVGAAQGTRGATGISGPLAARLAGHPYDQRRLERFDILVEALNRATPHHRRSDPDRERFVPFFEAYFSNYIEGTVFDLGAAHDMVVTNQPSATRPADSHDLLGTYHLVADADEMRYVASKPDEFVACLKRRHAQIMGGRPSTRPGELKTVRNQAGATVFVDPDLTEGTLHEGWKRLERLDTAWERSVYTMYLVSEVHPFADGNGRVARVMMNAELVADRQCRTIVPTVLRTDYLGALRLLSRDDNPELLIKVMRYASDYTAAIDFSAYATAAHQLEATNAFEEPESRQRLIIPQQTSLSAEADAADPP